MSKFKVGDIVVPVRADSDIYSESMKQMIGKPLAIINVAPCGDNVPGVLARGPLGVNNFWLEDDLWLFYEDQGGLGNQEVAEGPEPLVWVDGATHYQPHQGAFYKRVSAPAVDIAPKSWSRRIYTWKALRC